MNSYRTLKGYGRDRIEEKRSVFIGSAAFVTTEEEAIAFVNRIKNEFPDARHNVYAYLLREGQKTRYSDDREPQGTAGLPVLDVLRKQNYQDAVIVVTRYFGGILLGTGGLVRAYTDAAVAAVKAAGPVLRMPCTTLCFSCAYGEYPRYQQLLGKLGVTAPETEFGAEVSLRFSVESEEVERVSAEIFDASCGKIRPRAEGEAWQFVDIR